MACTALQVPNLVQREKHVFHKLRAFGQDRINHVSAGVFKPGQIGVTIDTQNFVEDEMYIADGGGIAWHFRSLE
jgi:hypothetical protein